MKKAINDFFVMLKKNKQGTIGLILMLVIILLGVLAPIVAPYDPEMTNAAHARLGPSLAHLFGTDETGMDVFSRCIYAIRIDVVIGVCGTFVSLLIGIPIGLLAGYYEGLVGEVILRLADLIQAFPAFILAMALVAVLGNSTQNILMVVAFVNVPIYTRFVRGEVLAMKSRPFIEAAQAAGMSPLRIMFKELLPNSLRPALVQASINIGGAILLTAGLSYIGAGVNVPTPEWGSMISIGAPLILTGQWWAAFFPGVCIGVTVFGFALFGDFLRIYLNPERR
ncbi:MULTISPECIES: ABC transporter permease [Anaerotruncus]|jgi:peptide/nickel transport system permease protein|uniref:ABC transporter permease n=1 Tax=Anaerotruncus TaxID=244127 RepID=UPI0008344E8D|nr:MULTISPECIES: ABC transporter permease [Anaerotruncus]MDD3165394.1 ABC transporter permease [Oscillospiraceae bacterium]